MSMTSTTGKRAAFISGLIWGGLLGATAVFSQLLLPGKRSCSKCSKKV
ncbi:hypothetical protein NBRC111894_3100 [Sporolactobacillus inulinus]|uniref:Uncharacterized protein n=1 Tax=Sporolactobacillus inulinus TaxID=2078 RepID=A0A4Y1ZEF4_9BACL|nr:hypothetical protein NBRC111894_3100 [Sporolactobacillus inulinus]